MAIITISRELAALGDETAHELARLLNYRFVDKQVLEDRIKSYGVMGRKFEKYDERKPSFWASLSQDRDDYLHYLKTAIYTEAAEGGCVFIGRGAGVVFRNVPGVISIFLVAPYDIRAERVKSYFHCDDKRARQIIEQSDHDRKGFHHYFFDVEWQDPGNYHLSINTGYLPPAASADIAKNYLEHTVTADTDAQNMARIKELTLAQQIKHHIIYEKEIPIHFLEASVSNNMATLYGVANSQSLIEAALTAAREVAGSVTVQTEVQIVQEYAIMH
ncbi:phospholipid-binding protein [Spirochaetia bacterium]|nr:phospholipid-binding protein [Spirochaetia bacterium]GHV54100.1 phospholipid-binding protein [Spirochaetia bacterium]